MYSNDGFWPEISHAVSFVLHVVPCKLGVSDMLFPLSNLSVNCSYAFHLCIHSLVHGILDESDIASSSNSASWCIIVRTAVLTLSCRQDDLYVVWHFTLSCAVHQAYRKNAESPVLFFSPIRVMTYSMEDIYLRVPAYSHQ